MNNPCISAFSCHALSVSDKRSESCPVFRIPCLPSWILCSRSCPRHAAYALRTRIPWEGGPSASLSHTPGQPLNVTLSTRMQKNNPRHTFQCKCSGLICIRADCFFYKPVAACDASITYTASGTTDKAELLPKIRTCSSRSKYETVLKLRWRAIQRHRHLTLNSFFASVINFQLDCGRLTGCNITTLLPAPQNHYHHQKSPRFHYVIQCDLLDSSREAMETNMHLPFPNRVRESIPPLTNACFQALPAISRGFPCILRWRVALSMGHPQKVTSAKHQLL